MGKAGEFAKALQQTRERKWVLDPDTGKITPEEEPAVEPQAPARPQPKPIQAAYRTYD